MKAQKVTNKAIIWSCLIWATTFLFGYGQQDPAAAEILDNLNKQNEKNYPFRLVFDYVYESQQTGETTSKEGTLAMDDIKFRLSYGATEIFFDGETMWNYNKEVREVYVSEPDPNAEDLLTTNPALFLRGYKDRFKYRLKGEIQVNGKTRWVVDLYPYDLERSYHRIRIHIDKNSDKLQQISLAQKNGEIHTVKINRQENRINTGRKFFSFNPEEHPEVEVYDMRF